MRESKIEKYLRVEVAKLGGWMEKHTSPGTRGVPDNIVLWSSSERNGYSGWVESTRVPGRLGLLFQVPRTEFIETKAPGGKLSVLQQRDHESRRYMGYRVHVIWDMGQAETYLRERGKK